MTERETGGEIVAEFIEVARAKRRMCNAHKKKCSECKLQENCSLLNVFAYKDNEVKKLENEVMSWAAEHPEPVYPTWVEYLVGIGVIPHEIRLETADALMDTHLLKPICADIAQKLGIEPKEG